MVRTSVLTTATLAAAAACLLAVPGKAHGAVAAPSCGAAALTVSATQPQGATGHGSLVLRFKNRSAHACTVRGYPGLDALDVVGHVMKHATRTPSGFAGGSAHGVQTILVRPDHFASATVEWLNFRPTTGGTCRFSAHIAITPPNTSATVHRARSVSVCRLQVHPAVAGRSGNG